MPGRPALALLASALLIALPAAMLTHDGFEPVARRATIDSSAGGVWTFTLPAAESVFLEGEVIVRQAVAAPAGAALPTVSLSLNGQDAGRLSPSTRFVAHGFRVLLPRDAVRAGANTISASVDDALGASFEVRARLHNYYGISPRFPRAVVVADEAVDERSARTPVLARTLRFSAIVVLGLIVTAVAGRLSHALTGRARTLVVPAPLLLWIVLVWSIATPLHVWLSPGALVLLLAAPMLLAALGAWLAARRRVVWRLAIVTAVTVAVLEAGLRAINYLQPSPIFYTGVADRFRGRPGAPFLDGRLNSRGFNDVERSLEKPPGVFRIVALGDSVVFGVVPRRDNYLARLEAELSASRPTEVLNMGVPGTTPADYLAVLIREGLAYSPDLVLATVFIGNDFETPTRHWYERSFTTTYLYFLWRLATAGESSGARSDTAEGIYRDDAPTFGEHRFLEIEVDRAWIYRSADARVDAAVRRVAATLVEMRRVVEGAGARFVVAIAPDEAQVDPTLRARVAAALGEPAEGGALDFRRPSAALAAALGEAGITTIDLLPAFQREAASGTRLYKPHDTHWNLAGNRLAAETIRVQF